VIVLPRPLNQEIRVPATFIKAAPYQRDAMALPVADVDAAIPFYTGRLGFRVARRSDTPLRSVVLARDNIEIGLVENGGDPSQDGCYFEVDDVAAAFGDFHGRPPGPKDLGSQTHGGRTFQVFFVVAPDGLCYMIGRPS
jgi:catechol 2,3-dioxygenase-like lactoylglutathione lyase family enzyme